MANRPIVLPRWGELVGQQGVVGPNESAPTSGRQDTGWLPAEEPPAPFFNWYKRINYDWLQWLDQQAQGGSPYLLDFEGLGFPPIPGNSNIIMTTPSPRYPTDLSWIRSTSSPIAGTASASAPTPQGVSTFSSMGCTATLLVPSRFAFMFVVNGNFAVGNSDRIEFYVDGVLTGQFCPQTSNTVVGGKFITDPLREGTHTFDFRFVRGTLASTAGEECRVDQVEISPEEVWRTDPTRLWFIDECFVGSDVGIAIPASSVINRLPWTFITGANPGTFAQVNVPGSGGRSLGAFGVISAATGAGDYATAQLSFNTNLAPLSQQMFIEFRCGPASAPGIAQQVNEWGWSSFGAPTGDSIVWSYDGSFSTTNLIYKAILAGVATNRDSGIASSNTVAFRLGISTAQIRGINTAIFIKDGKALISAGGVPPLMVAGMPAVGSIMVPTVRARSVTTAATSQANVDTVKILGLR